MRAIHVSRQDIERFEPPEPCLIISVVDPLYPEAAIEPNQRVVGIHRVNPFHDIDNLPDGEVSVGIAPGHTRPKPEQYVLFDRERAKKIAEFVYSSPKVRLIVAHCEAGISRSAGIAAALQDHFYMDQHPGAFQTGIPNKLVYRLLFEELYRYREALIFAKVKPS